MRTSGIHMSSFVELKRIHGINIEDVFILWKWHYAFLMHLVVKSENLVRTKCWRCVYSHYSEFRNWSLELWEAMTVNLKDRVSEYTVVLHYSSWVFSWLLVSAYVWGSYTKTEKEWKWSLWTVARTHTELVKIYLYISLLGCTIP